jgi:hypothetical protein
MTDIKKGRLGSAEWMEGRRKPSIDAVNKESQSWVLRVEDRLLVV